jgi:hypothetical protein
LREVISGSLTRFWEQILSQYFLYVSEERDAVRIAFHDSYQLMKQAFHQRATCDSKFGPRLTAADFLMMMKDATLIDQEQEHLCMASFLTAQFNPPLKQELDALIFAEFVEAVARLSLKAIANYPGLTEGKKARMAFNMIVELLTNTQELSGGSTK